MLMGQPRSPIGKNGVPVPFDPDMDMFMADQLHLIARWLTRRRGGRYFEQAQFLNQPLDSNFGDRDFTDPMQTFLAGIGRA